MECGEVLKKYEKVDSFLKRCLPHDRYCEIRLIEPCVAVSEAYNKQFKFVVLAADWLYVTENPPKAAKDIREVTKIANIISVELLNDVPEFLGGDLKYRAQHILITYKKDWSSCEDTSRVCEQSIQIPDEVKTTPATGRKSAKSSPTLVPKIVQENYSTDRLYASDDSLEREFLENERSKKSKSRRSLLLTVNSLEKEDGGMETKPVSLHHSCSSLDDIKHSQRNNVKSMRLTASANSADLRGIKQNLVDENRLSKSYSGSAPSLASSQKKRGLLSSFNGFQKRFSERKTPRSPGNEKKIFQSSDDVSKELFSDENDKCHEINLYMLLDKTVMLPYLRSTWDNCLLNAALKQNKKGRSPNSQMKNKPSSSAVTELFDQLEKEIMDSKELKDTFVLVNELLTACQKNPLVKKLFWQSPKLFVFMVQQLKYYNSQMSCDSSKMNKADELEFMLLLLDCLAQMFRETEHLSTRMTKLRTDKCRVLHDLVEITISCPENKISKVVKPPGISEAAEILLTGRHRKKKTPQPKCPHDIELENLCNELTKCQVTLLHELFIIAYQAAWFPSGENKLNICWMIRILESSQTIHRFIQCFVLQMMNMMSIAETGDLSADNTTLLYRLFSVLKTILQQSTKLRHHIREFHTEEFRYYVNLHTLTKCLSRDCPLTPSTLKLVEDVTYLVTDTSNGHRRTPR